MKRTNFSYVAMLLGTVAVSGACGNPAVPSLATAPVIDRMGRPAVNTALTNPFDFYNQEKSDVTKDRYNANGDPSVWATNWTAPIALHLGILDALDNNCGNQVAYMPKYTLLAALLAGDAIQVDTSKTTCNQYLGAELGALGAPVSDCGGRRLDYDVVDVTYSALVAGVVSGVNDGISRVTNSSASFPFMVDAK